MGPQHPQNLYHRELCEVWQGSERRRAWVYVYARSVAGSQPLPAGRWLPEHEAGLPPEEA
ncbi:gamma-glutamylcyclotransferase [Deinococcus lacus]|uniref:Gamma-glutamylcyclotransferase n=1 Tax=Deinococcus lacus TaxID=392561 RepID=A0ABW1YD44_9DEIO